MSLISQVFILKFIRHNRISIPHPGYQPSRSSSPRPLTNLAYPPTLITFYKFQLRSAQHPHRKRLTEPHSFTLRTDRHTNPSRTKLSLQLSNQHHPHRSSSPKYRFQTNFPTIWWATSMSSMNTHPSMLGHPHFADFGRVLFLLYLHHWCPFEHSSR